MKTLTKPEKFWIMFPRIYGYEDGEGGTRWKHIETTENGGQVYHCVSSAGDPTCGSGCVRIERQGAYGTRTTIDC